MGSLSQKPHFVLFPFMAQGHLIPMVDIGRLLAQRDVIVTIVTTPHNAGRVQNTITRANESGVDIRLLQLEFPGKEVGLADGVESTDMLYSMDDILKLFIAANKMEEAVMKVFEKLTPCPICIISDMCLFYTHKIATKFHVPRILFHGFCCCCLLCLHNICYSRLLETITSDSEYFTVPGLPDKFEFTKLQLPLRSGRDDSWKQVTEPMIEADEASFGVIINTFEELESAYVKEYKKVKKAWCFGPVSLNHKDKLDKAERGNKTSINEHQCLKWLDSQESNSVIYACLGSVSSVRPRELIELGLGLEASNKPFIWVLRGNITTSSEVEKWIKEDGFEERTKGRGVVVLGWAPQVLILSHPAIGGFLTHCGWNSTIEGISAGVPLITLPLFADQFCNEKVAVQILKIGVSLGADKPTLLENDKSGFVFKKEDVKNAIDNLMDEGNEGIDRRKRAKEFGEKANRAVEEGLPDKVELTKVQVPLYQSESCKEIFGPIEEADQASYGVVITHKYFRRVGVGLYQRVFEGVPLITLPLLGDQFCNHKLVIQILKIGASLGADKPTSIGEEETGFILKKEHVKKSKISSKNLRKCVNLIEISHGDS